MNLDDIARRAREALELAGKATHGPWKSHIGDDYANVYDDDNDDVAQVFADDDVAFIASARSDVPALAADVLALVEIVRAFAEGCANQVCCDCGYRTQKAYQAFLAKLEAPRE